MGDPKPIREIRQRIIRLARGTVLEIGAGSGANFAHHDPARVTKLYALEPNPGMIRLAERQQLRTRLDVEYLDLPGERIPLEDQSVDEIVSTFTLGTIPDVLEALRGMRRVLRPGGKETTFSELGRAMNRKFIVLILAVLTSMPTGCGGFSKTARSTTRSIEPVMVDVFAAPLQRYIAEPISLKSSHRSQNSRSPGSRRSPSVERFNAK